MDGHGQVGLTPACHGTLLEFESRYPSILIVDRHKLRRGQHTLARQKIYKKNKNLQKNQNATVADHKLQHFESIFRIQVGLEETEKKSSQFQQHGL